MKDDPPFFGSIGPLVDAVKAKSGGTSAGLCSPAQPRGDAGPITKSCSRRRVYGRSEPALRRSGQSSQPKLQPGRIRCRFRASLRRRRDLYGITAVKHRWTPLGYSNRFWCTPWQKYTNPDPPVDAPMARIGSGAGGGAQRSRRKWAASGCSISGRRIVRPTGRG